MSPPTSLPPVVSDQEWRAARVELLDREKEFARQRDAVSVARRQLPMREVTADYRFTGPDGEVSLADLFGPRGRAGRVQPGAPARPRHHARGRLPGAVPQLVAYRVFHTYSTYARGLDALASTYNWLDLTVLGRQEDWEEPPGRSDGPAMHWLRRHDEYGAREDESSRAAEAAPTS